MKIVTAAKARKAQFSLCRWAPPCLKNGAMASYAIKDDMLLKRKDTLVHCSILLKRLPAVTGAKGRVPRSVSRVVRVRVANEQQNTVER